MSKFILLLILKIFCLLVETKQVKKAQTDSQILASDLQSACQSISKAVQVSQSPPSESIIRNFFLPSRYSAIILTLCNPMVHTFSGSYANTNITIAKLRMFTDGPAIYYTLMFQVEKQRRQTYSGSNVQAVLEEYTTGKMTNRKLLLLSYKLNNQHMKIRVQDKQLWAAGAFLGIPEAKTATIKQSNKFKTLYFNKSQLSGYSLVGALIAAVGLLVYHLVFMQEYEPIKIVEFLRIHVSPYSVFPLLFRLLHLGWIFRSTLVTQDCLPYLSYGFQLLLLYPIYEFVSTYSIYNKAIGPKSKLVILYCFLLSFLAVSFLKQVIFYCLVLIPQVRNRKGQAEMKLWLMTLSTIYMFLMLYLHALDLRREVNYTRLYIILLLWLLQVHFFIIQFCLAYVSIKRTNRKKSGGMTEHDCGICLDAISEDELFRTKCNHIFHKKCIWLSVSFKNECPMDRSRLDLHQIEQFMDQEQ